MHTGLVNVLLHSPVTDTSFEGGSKNNLKRVDNVKVKCLNIPNVCVIGNGKILERQMVAYSYYLIRRKNLTHG